MRSPGFEKTLSPFGSFSHMLKDIEDMIAQSSSTGSPLGLFLALRKVDPAKGRGLGSRQAAALMLGNPATLRQGDGLPAVRRMYNLYHPFDPIGYRCAPL